eukprot:TRINITY_DN863_c0_g1_i8.p1 TRINITY_DN863_c0_g1~~TRINITY_DN863_c0_g1_i8.p1  ORF type:complete len:335 (-),score=102.83 TRINITY_DN863_c0_g1_i8:149-1153(-)
MNLSRIALWLLLVVAVFTIAAASSDEHPEEALGEGDDEQAVGEEHDGEASEGDDELAPGEGDADLALGEEHDGEASGGDDADSVYEHALSEVQIGNMMKKIDFNGDGKASLDEFKLFAKNSALLEAQNSFDEQHPAETFVVKTVDEHLEEIRKKYEGFDDEGMLELDRQKHLAADENKDGKLDKDEYFQYFSSSNEDVLKIDARINLKRLDANGDGFVDFDEFLKEIHGEQALGGDSEGEEDRAAARKDAEKQFGLMDKDKNGKLDVDEYASYFTNHHQDELDSVFLIEAADADKDGFLDLNELVKYMGSGSNEHLQLGTGLLESWASINGFEL